VENIRPGFGRGVFIERKIGLTGIGNGLMLGATRGLAT
jgi:hypothetical protein